METASQLSAPPVATPERAHAARARPAALRLEAVTTDAGLAALEEPWQALFAAAADATPFQSFEWQATWWQHHGQGRLWVLTAWDGDVLAALLPLTVTRYRGTPLRHVRFMAAPLSDVQEMLALPGYGPLAARTFVVGERVMQFFLDHPMP